MHARRNQCRFPKSAWLASTQFVVLYIGSLLGTFLLSLTLQHGSLLSKPRPELCHLVPPRSFWVPAGLSLFHNVIQGKMLGSMRSPDHEASRAAVTHWKSLFISVWSSLVAVHSGSIFKAVLKSCIASWRFPSRKCAYPSIRNASMFLGLTLKMFFDYLNGLYSVSKPTFSMCYK